MKHTLWTPQRRLRRPWEDAITPAKRGFQVDRRKLLFGAGAVAAAAGLDIASPNIVRAATLAAGETYPKLPFAIPGIDFVVGRTSTAALQQVTTANVDTYIPHSGGSTYDPVNHAVYCGLTIKRSNIPRSDFRGLNIYWANSLRQRDL